MVHVTAPEWTEGRLDELSDKVDRGFEKVDQRFERVDRRLERIDARLDGMQRTMVQAAIGMTAAILASFGGIIALIATQI
jgi:tetrahydromethanopterin S-methyltransferase subunit G